jgi:hypothetical protein
MHQTNTIFSSKQIIINTNNKQKMTTNNPPPPPAPFTRQRSAELAANAVSGSIPNVRAFHQQFDSMRKKEMSPAIMCFIPLVCLFILVFLTFGVASTVFSIQALVVGADTYQSGPQCQRDVGVWLIVFGSLTLGGGCLKNCKENSKEVNENGELVDVQKPTLLSNIGNLAATVGTCWLFYGVSLVYNQPRLACNQSQYHVFYILVLVLFYLWVSVMGLCCLAFPCMMCAMAGMEDKGNGDSSRRFNFGAAGGSGGGNANAAAGGAASTGAGLAGTTDAEMGLKNAGQKPEPGAEPGTTIVTA